MRRRPITVQYPYEKLIPSERFRGRIHFEFDKCISCEVCVRVCPINLPVVDWDYNKETKKKQLKHSVLILGSVFSVETVWNTAPPIASR
jgi:NAD(P)H-quinone oxidoreductase subunit I